MEAANIILLFTLCLSFFGTSLCFFLFSATRENFDSFWPLFTISFIGFPILYFINPTEHDSLYPLSTIEIFAVLGLSLFVFLGSKTKLTSTLCIAIAAITITLLLPQNFLLLNGILPMIADKIFIALIIFSLTYGFKYLNAVNGVSGLQMITVCAGITALYILGISPFLLCAFAVLLFSALGSFMLQAFSSHPLKISSSGCQALGLIIIWLSLKASQEGAAPCILIFLCLLIAETITVFAKKILPSTRKKTSLENTNIYYAYASGLSEKDLNIELSKFAFLSIVLGVFQIFSPNSTSVPVLAFLFALWFINRLRNWQENIKASNQSAATHDKEEKE